MNKAENILNAIDIDCNDSHGNYEIVNYNDILEMIQNYPSAKGSACTIDAQKQLSEANKELEETKRKLMIISEEYEINEKRMRNIISTKNAQIEILQQTLIMATKTKYQL